MPSRQPISFNHGGVCRKLWWARDLVSASSGARLSIRVAMRSNPDALRGSKETPEGVAETSVPTAPLASAWSASQIDLLVSETTPMQPGLRLDRYELLCPVARGGMASVWVARLRGKHGFEKLVAVKTILADRSDDVRFRRMFLDEARIASGIDHIHVVRILDLGEQGGLLYLVMEWVDGDSLSRLQRAVQQTGAQVSPGIALRAVADASSGLHAAHNLRDRKGAHLGVVHRDVSPQNILLSVEGVAKVIDFGIAKARDRTAGDTSDGALKGKLLYMAPEQALGWEIDRRADVWSLGAVLYHLLAGSPPFKGPTEAATFAFLTSGLPPQPLPSDIPVPVARVVRRALSPLGERYSTAAELQQAIEEAMVESHLTTSLANVAAYVDEHLGKGVAARRTLVHKAIEASAMREAALSRGGPYTPAQWEIDRRVVASAVAAPATSRRGIVSKAAFAIGSCAVAVGLVAATRGHLADAPSQQGGQADFGPWPIPSAAALTAVTPAPTSLVDSSPRVDPPEGATAEAPVARTPPSLARASKHAAPPSVSAHATTAECDPPYAVDSDGIRRYKRACLR